MQDDIDTELPEETEENAIARWMPAAVVLAVIVGFVSLTWYAYHTGMKSIKEEDLMVVEADKTPLKEKPADPGGMQFPDQDKTVFETFSGNAQQPPKVERVVPSPEEPAPMKTDTSGTTTWVNDKLHAEQDTNTAPEQVIGQKKPDAAPVTAPTPEPAKKEVAAPKIIHIDAKPVDDSKPAEPAPAPVEKPAEAKPQPEKKAAKAPAPKKAEEAKEKTIDEKADLGGPQVQLGAYRSEQEASDAWDKMQKKLSVLGDREPIIVKADLGQRGIFYRLRVGGFDSASQAGALCKKLSSSGQACLVAK
jgi:cell division protein FtsN